MNSARRPRRFFSDIPLTGEGQTLRLPSSETRHIRKTLRLQPGDSILITDGQGHEGLARIEAFEETGEARVCLSQVISQQEPVSDLPALRLFSAFAAKGVMEELVEKCQELGVTEFYPLLTERTAVALAGEKEGKVLERWYKIAREAAKQSGNARLVQLSAPLALEAAFKIIPLGEEAVFFHPEPESGLPVKIWLQQSAGARPAGVNLFIGPEGGFTRRELDAAKAAAQRKGSRFVQIWLGPATLRVSTAAVAAVSAVKFLR